MNKFTLDEVLTKINNVISSIKKAFQLISRLESTNKNLNTI